MDRESVRSGRIAAQRVRDERDKLAGYDRYSPEQLEGLARARDATAMIARGDAFLRAYPGSAKLPHADYVSHMTASQHWYELAYDAAHSLLSIHRLATSLLTRGYVRKAVALLEEGSTANDPVSAYWIARLSRQHNLADPPAIRKLYEHAAKLGHIRARGNLSTMLLKGEGGPPDVIRGMHLYLSSVIDAFRVAKHDTKDPLLW